MPNGSEPRETRELQLAGQIMYRRGDAGQAATLFQKSESVGGPSGELATNILAALVSAGRGADALEYAKAHGGGEEGGASAAAADGTHFELFYNHACAAIAAGQLGLAKRLLGQAIDVCRKTLSGEDYTEEEVEVRTHAGQRAREEGRAGEGGMGRPCGAASAGAALPLCRCCHSRRCSRQPLPCPPRCPLAAHAPHAP